MRSLIPYIASAKVVFALTPNTAEVLAPMTMLVIRDLCPAPIPMSCCPLPTALTSVDVLCPPPGTP